MDANSEDKYTSTPDSTYVFRNVKLFVVQQEKLESVYKWVIAKEFSEQGRR